MSDAMAMLKELSQPWQPGEFVKDALKRAAALAGIGESRAFDIWYGKARRVDADEIAMIADALNRRNKKAARNELHDLKVRIAKLEALFAGTDQDLDWSPAAGDRPRLRVAGGARSSIGGR